MADDISLKILLVDAVGSRADELRRVLGRAGYRNVHTVPGGPALAVTVACLNPDLVIVDMGLAERDILESLRETTARSPCPIILRADVDDPVFIEDAISAGVSSYHTGSVDPASIKPIMTAAIALFRRYRRSEEEKTSAIASLEERRIIEQAKATLIRRRGMSEPEAYRWLRSKAMRESRKMSAVAAELVAGEKA